MPNLVIFGAGGFGREVLQLVRDLAANRVADWHAVAFLIDPQFCTNFPNSALPVLTDDSMLRRDDSLQLVIAVGSPAARRNIAARFSWLPEDRFVTLVHPRAYVGRLDSIGVGSIVCAGAVLTTNIVLGRHTQVHAGATVGHDTQMEDFVSVYPGANVAGHVRLRSGTELGSGSIVLPTMEVGRWSVVGAGAVVHRPLPPNVTAVGNPARVIKSRPEGWESKEASD